MAGLSPPSGMRCEDVSGCPHPAAFWKIPAPEAHASKLSAVRAFCVLHGLAEGLGSGWLSLHVTEQTERRLVTTQPLTLICRVCRMRSWNPFDARELYCARCGD